MLLSVYLASFISYTRYFRNFFKVFVVTTMTIATLPSKAIAICVSVTSTWSCFQTNSPVDVSFIRVPKYKYYVHIIIKPNVIN